MKFQRSLATETIIDAQSIPSAQNSADFPQKNIFKFKRRGFHSNLASSTQGPPYKGGPPENPTLSQVSQTKQKIQNQKKKFKRAKIAH